MSQKRIPAESAESAGERVIEKEAAGIYRVNVDYGDISAGIWRAKPSGADGYPAPVGRGVQGWGAGGGGYFQQTGGDTYTLTSTSITGLYNSTFGNYSTPPDNGMMAFGQNKANFSYPRTTTSFSALMELDVYETARGGSPTFTGRFTVSVTTGGSATVGNVDEVERDAPAAVPAPYSIEFGTVFVGANTAVNIPHTSGAVGNRRVKVRNVTTPVAWGTAVSAELLTFGYTPGGGVFHNWVPDASLTRLVEF